MKGLLLQISVLFGGIVSTFSLVFNLSRRTDLLTAVFRAGVVFGVSLLVSVIFLQFFASVLHRFVTEEMVRRNTEKQSEDRQHQNASRKQADVKDGAPRLDVPRPSIPPRS
jgi:hypothetical protein